MQSRFEDCTVSHLPDLLQPGDVLVVNNTRVIPARLHGVRVRQDNRANIEVTLHKREGDNVWRAFAKPAKRLKQGDRIRFGDDADNYACELGHLDAEVSARGDAGEVLLEFALSGAHLDEAIERIGEMPLPPYIAGRRAADTHDADDYQTLFAKNSGAVAAPTASLHFTPALVEALHLRGVEIVPVTLHVGAGTFLPVKADDTADHVMHAEFGEISRDAADRINAGTQAWRAHSGGRHNEPAHSGNRCYRGRHDRNDCP